MRSDLGPKRVVKSRGYKQRTKKNNLLLAICENRNYNIFLMRK